MFLRDIWYLALPGEGLKPGRIVPKTLLGERLIIGRDSAGAPFCLRDFCPHRGMPLSFGHFDGREIECCYHGWRFDPSGRCTAIPSLVEAQSFDLDRIKAVAYPCREVQGNIWVFFPSAREAPEPLPEIPEVPAVGSRSYQLALTMVFPCAVDHAVVGLMDPAHGPFVHRSWFWRSRRSAHEKERRFEPSPFGFRMVRHQPSSNSRAYKLLGRPTTEITFRLPGIRVEHIESDNGVVCNLTAVTPIDKDSTQINHLVYWTIPWLGLLKPLARRLGRTFLDQDRETVARQQLGLAGAPALLLIDDADRPAKWYYRIKAEFARAQDEGRAFVNPVKERVLRWRS